MTTRTAAYRRGSQRRSFVLTRLGRLAAICANLTRGLLLLAFAATPFWYAATNDQAAWAAVAAVATLPPAWQRIRSLRNAVRGWGGRKNPAGVPGAVRAAVEDLTATFGLRRKRVTFLPYHRPGMHPPLAAMAAGTDGAVLMLNPQLTAKAEAARPGDPIDNEVRAVVAHELAHWYSWDSLLGTLAATAWIVAVGGGLLTAALTQTDSLPPHAWVFAAWPIPVFLASRAASRGAEYRADARAVQVTGEPGALAAALLRDFGNQPRQFRTLIATHPATADRVRRLTADDATAV